MNQNIFTVFSIVLLLGILVPAYAQSSDIDVVINSDANLTDKVSTESQESKGITVTVSTEESSYLFGDTVVIQGNVSKKVNPVTPEFLPAQIILDISGPDFERAISLYPDLNLNYKTTLSLHSVLGINEGTFDVSVNYAGAVANTSFSVGFESIKHKEEIEGSLGITTDKSQYIPGQTVLISGFATKVIPFEGMRFTLTDSRGDVIARGELYPIDGKFTTSVFITTVEPVFGTFKINAEYSDKSVSTTFEVVEDIKEDVSISLWTDKAVYGLGEEVKITGRLNQIWVSTLDLEIIQTRQTSIGSLSAGSSSGFKIQDGVRIMGDGSFSYSFTIPDTPIRLGDYRIDVSEDIGSATMIIHAVSNPDEFVVSDQALTVILDKADYNIGDKMTISGFVRDPVSNSSYETGSSVKIYITHEDGTPLEIIGLPNEAKGGTRADAGITVSYDFTAVPETSGSYMLQVDITANIFAEGGYVLTSQYAENTVTETFTVTDPLDLSDGAIISLDREVYGLGQTVYLTGVLPPTADSTVDILLTRPDGTATSSGAPVDSQHFSWSWATPITETYQNIRISNDRQDTKTNFGIYKITIYTSSNSMDLFFKVSSDPENDSLSTTPLSVYTGKSLYKAGERLEVAGNVVLRKQGNEGLVVPDRVHITIADGAFPFGKIHESSVYPNQGGEFSSIFELPITVFSQGSYTVKAIYNNIRTETTFSITNDFVFDLDEPVSLLVSTDKSEYHPGDTVIISGKPNKIIYLEKFDVSVIQKDDAEIMCGSFICGIHVGPITSIRPSPSGSFTHEFVIPDSMSAVGSYEITVDADFETRSIQFDVIRPPTLSSTVIERENRIPSKMISIHTGEKTVDGKTVAPRVISGSLITSRADESGVNLMVSDATGTCIIGPDVSCMVRESTKRQGQIYSTIRVDGTDYNVRYSGPDVRLEKFSILPESSTEFLPDADWSIKVIKDEQVSRFYYKVTYRTLG